MSSKTMWGAIGITSRASAHAPRVGGSRGRARADPVALALGSAGLPAALALLPLAFLLLDWVGQAATDGGALFALALPTARTWRLLGNSLALAAATSFLAGSLGVTLALWLYAADGRLTRVVRRAYLVPLLVPTYVHALAWLSIAGRRQALDQIVALLASPDRVTVTATGFGPAVFVLGLAFAPLVTLLALGGLEAIDSQMVEEALVLQPGWAVVKRVLVPLAAPAILGGVGLVFVLALVEYGVPSSLQYNVYAMEIYAQFSQSADPVRAMSSALALLVPAVALLATMRLLIGDAALRGGSRRVASLDLGAWPLLARVALVIGVSASGLASVGTIAILAARTGSAAALVRAVETASGEIRLSVEVALIAATATALLMVPLAGSLASQRSASPLWLALILPLAVPSPLLGISMISLTNSAWLDWARETPLVLAFGHAVRLLPFAAFAAAAQARRVDPGFLEAAALHDVGRWRRLWQITLPLLLPALAVAWLVTFVFSLGELGVGLLVSPPGQATLPIRVYNLMHYGATDSVAALSLVGLAAAGAGFAAFGILRRTLWAWMR